MAYQISISATSVLGWSCRAGKWMENKAPRRLSATWDGAWEKGPQKGSGCRNESRIHANSLGWQPTSRHWLVVSHLLRFQSLRIGFCRWILCRTGSFDPRIGFIVIVRYISRERCRLWIWGGVNWVNPETCHQSCFHFCVRYFWQSVTATRQQMVQNLQKHTNIYIYIVYLILYNII